MRGMGIGRWRPARAPCCRSWGLRFRQFAGLIHPQDDLSEYNSSHVHDQGEAESDNDPVLPPRAPPRTMMRPESRASNMNVFSWLVTYVFSFGVATDPDRLSIRFFPCNRGSIGSGMPFGKAGGVPARGLRYAATGATVRCRKQAPQGRTCQRTETPAVLGLDMGGTHTDAVLLRGGTLLASSKFHQPSGFAGFTREACTRCSSRERRFRRT